MLFSFDRPDHVHQKLPGLNAGRIVMLTALFNKIRDNEFQDLHGHLNCRIPMSLGILNTLIDKAEENVRAIRNITVLEIRDDILVLNIVLSAGKIGMRDIDVVDRDLTLKISRFLGPPNFPLQLEILKGTRKIENNILEFLFRRKLEKSAIDFEDRKITFQHGEIFQGAAYQFLLSKLESAEIDARDNVLFFNLSFNFDA